MGRRDFRRRETKKLKKTGKKESVANILSPPETVEIIRKGKKNQEEE